MREKLTAPFIIDFEGTRWRSVTSLMYQLALFPDVKIGVG